MGTAAAPETAGKICGEEDELREEFFPDCRITVWKEET